MLCEASVVSKNGGDELRVGEGVEVCACYFHPHTRAVAQCLDFGKHVCTVCVRTINTKPYCEACAANRYEQSPWLALIFGILVPGMGQIYNGQFVKGLLLFATGWLIVPWIYGIADAIATANAIKMGKFESKTVPPGYILLILKFGIIPLAGIYIAGLTAIFSFILYLVRLLM